MPQTSFNVIGDDHPFAMLMRSTKRPAVQEMVDMLQLNKRNFSQVRTGIATADNPLTFRGC
jgi:hypothetical protein